MFYHSIKKTPYIFSKMMFTALLTVCLTKASAQNTDRLRLIDSLFDYICEMKIEHPEIVFKQAMLETGWLKSPYLVNKNNFFGFRGQQYLTFKSWKESVDYYKKWQQKRYTNSNEDYYKFLIRIKYATSNTYIQNLKKINSKKSCR